MGRRRAIWIANSYYSPCNIDPCLDYSWCCHNVAVIVVVIPSGETLLSPLVMCGPQGVTFQKPVELRLPHCASANPESWSFALKSSEAHSGQFFPLMLFYFHHSVKRVHLSSCVSEALSFHLFVRRRHFVFFWNEQEKSEMSFEQCSANFKEAAINFKFLVYISMQCYDTDTMSVLTKCLSSIS